jgi:MSHA biogenesis protein MshN
MSVINKMLQELDQRHATPVASGSAVRPLRGSPQAGKGREAFWRLLAFLMLACVAGVGVLVYQVQLQPLVTNLAFKAAEDARMRPPVPPTSGPSVSPTAAPPVAPVAVATAPASPPVPEPTLKLASSIETAIPAERPRKPVAEPVTVAVPKQALSASVPVAAPAPRIVGGPSISADRPVLEKRDRPRTPREQAEADFRRAVASLNDGRIGDAQDALGAALAADRTHDTARQALASLLLEQRRIDLARRVLQEGIAISPGNLVFAHSLARILMEGKDYEGALVVLQGTGAAGASNADIQSLIGAAQQRAGRHRESMQAYQAALRLSPSSGSSWIGLGVSLEALGHRPEAAEAFRRAIATGSLTAELRGIADTRLSQIQ